MSEIPRLEQRLGAITYQRSFKEKLGGVLPGIKAVTDASNKLKSSKNFKKIFEVSLFFKKKNKKQKKKNILNLIFDFLFHNRLY